MLQTICKEDDHGFQEVETIWSNSSGQSGSYMEVICSKCGKSYDGLRHNEIINITPEQALKVRLFYY